MHACQFDRERERAEIFERNLACVLKTKMRFCKTFDEFKSAFSPKANLMDFFKCFFSQIFWELSPLSVSVRVKVDWKLKIEFIST